MKIQMTNAGPALTESDIAQFEQRIGMSLPQAFRAFLQRFNGGRPTPYHFVVPGWRFHASLINDFNGILPGEFNDLEDTMELMEDRLPKGFIPIADDPGGNCVLLSLEGLTRGRVYFWDHENEPNAPSDALSDYRNIHLLANDFEQFLNALRDDDESDGTSAPG